VDAIAVSECPLSTHSHIRRLGVRAGVFRSRNAGHFIGRQALLGSEVCVGSEIMFDQGIHPREKVRIAGAIFDRLWPVDDASGFAVLLRAIDEALLRHQCRSRLDRFHRMLQRVQRA
jgi:hypothetical protein